MTTLAVGLVLVVCGIALWPPAGEHMAVAAAGAGPESREQSDGAATDVALTAQLLVIALRTGLPVTSALERVAEHSGPHVAADLHRVVRAYARHPDDPVLAWGAAPDIWRPVGAALAVAARAGVAPGELLLTAARGVLRRESEAREVAIGRAGVRLVLPLGLVLLPAFMCTTVLPLLLVMTRRHLGG